MCLRITILPRYDIEIVDYCGQVENVADNLKFPDRLSNGRIFCPYVTLWLYYSGVYMCVSNAFMLLNQGIHSMMILMVCIFYLEMYALVKVAGLEIKYLQSNLHLHDKTFYHLQWRVQK